MLLARTHIVSGQHPSTAYGPAVLGRDDPESLLAAGQRLPLSCVDVYALELISGISDGVANGLLIARSRITTAVQSGLSERTALQFAKGVGPQNSEKLLRFIRVLGECLPFSTNPASTLPFDPSEQGTLSLQ